MTEVTLTELRKDLFRLIDEMVETGRPLRIRRRGRSIDLTARTPEKAGVELGPEERFDRYMALGPRPGWENCPDDIDTNKSHVVWNIDDFDGKP